MVKKEDPSQTPSPVGATSAAGNSEQKQPSTGREEKEQREKAKDRKRKRRAEEKRQIREQKRRERAKKRYLELLLLKEKLEKAQRDLRIATRRFYEALDRQRLREQLAKRMWQRALEHKALATAKKLDLLELEALGQRAWEESGARDEDRKRY